MARCRRNQSPSCRRKGWKGGTHSCCSEMGRCSRSWSDIARYVYQGDTHRSRADAAYLPVMVVSYETLRTLQEELEGCPVGLLLCDEGHRLKNSGECLCRCVPRSSLDNVFCRLANFPSSQCAQRPASSDSIRNTHPERPFRILFFAEFRQPGISRYTAGLPKEFRAEDLAGPRFGCYREGETGK
jgi:hypothetical protein